MGTVSVREPASGVGSVDRAGHRVGLVGGMRGMRGRAAMLTGGPVREWVRNPVPWAKPVRNRFS
ncbi:hypothetical protein GCM10022243_33430 [Saccharothrix violaceirubra]